MRTCVRATRPTNPVIVLQSCPRYRARRIAFALSVGFVGLFAQPSTSRANPYPVGAVYCNTTGEIDCQGSWGENVQAAESNARSLCETKYGPCELKAVVHEGCFALAVSGHTRNTTFQIRPGLIIRATTSALQDCQVQFGHCSLVIALCKGEIATWDAASRTYPDGSSVSGSEPVSTYGLQDYLDEYLVDHGYYRVERILHRSDLTSILGVGFAFVLGLIIILTVYRKRATIARFIVRKNP